MATHSLGHNNLMADCKAFNQLCIHCMHDKGPHHALCHHCGYHDRHYQPHPLYLQPKTVLENQYIVGKALGQGGFGITYVGLDRWLRKKVAIKEYLPAALATRDLQTAQVTPLKQQQSAFEQGLQLFIEEARNLAKFDHPHIVRVINFFQAHHTGYMVMDYLEGHSLVTQLTQAGGRLTLEHALAIIFPIFDALSVIHAQQLYHRDISLHNILILNTGLPVLIDFGAARHIIGEYSHSLDLVLKHGYSPLEQYSGKGKIGPWTDVYACGALLYLMLTGHLPPAAPDRFYEDTLVAPAQQIPLPPVINAAIMRALAIKREERFPTIEDFRHALQNPSAALDAVFQPLQTRWWPLPLFNYLIITLLFLLPHSTGIQNQISILEILLTQAQHYWQQAKLVTPKHQNAYATYQQVLKIDPDNAQAQAGIQSIIDYYHQLAQIAQDQGRLVESLTWINQALEVMPSQPTLLAVHTQLQQQLKQRAHIEDLLQQARAQITAHRLKAAYQSYQSILKLAPKDQHAQVGLEHLAHAYAQRAKNSDLDSALALIHQGLELFPQHPQLSQQLHNLTQQYATQSQRRQIQTLLTQAQNHLNALRLTEPVGDNAYELYQHILTLEPHNQAARQGLKTIADEYYRLATIEQQDLEHNLALIQKGLNVLPHHQLLQQLQQQLIEQLQQPPQQSSTAPNSNPSDQPSKATEKAPLEAHPVDNLLHIAQQHLAAGRLEAAYQTYKNIISLDANHPKALTGLQHIADQYEQLARQQHQQGALAQSLTFIDKGLAAVPQHSQLLALRQQLIEKNEPSESQPIIFTPSF